LHALLLAEHGVWAHLSNLNSWVSAQSLPMLETNEDFHAHSCGEYAWSNCRQGLVLQMA